MISRDFVSPLSILLPQTQALLFRKLAKSFKSSNSVRPISCFIVAPPKQVVVLAASFLDSRLAYHDVVVVILALSIFHRRCTYS